MEETASLIHPENYWVLWAILIGWAGVAIILEQKYSWASKLSGAIIALAGAMLLSNTGIIPLDSPVYDTVWTYVVPLAIPLLLFQSNVVKVWQESKRLLIIFLISTIGTVAGTIAAFFLLKDVIPQLNYIGAMLSGSYTGGGVNFAAMATRFNVEEGTISSTVVADNLLMVLYFFILITIPAVNFFRSRFQTPHMDELEKNGDSENQASEYWKGKEISLQDIAKAIGTAFVIVAVSFSLAGFFSNLIPEDSNIFLSVIRGIIGDNYLMLTTLTLISVAVFPKYFESISGSQEFGTFFIYIFFVVIGVPASIPLIIQNAPLILVFAAIIVFINMVFSFGFGRLFKFNLEEIILASNANIGGPTTAAAMAISRGWTKLVGPILIIGTLGYIIGNYIGTSLGVWFTSLM
ncbi:hypothetical protein BN1048_02241 [Jeotgalicoccus saudimassiliensis]|uniref:DUF819 domain-containing protein n=1 Tax=Jeotgalicoccus saudimassiliensis TaxID=1461582 RepID=A0A078M8W3_9STAP|nr:DUF819 family protein [Jeotgalicoccus saudimassiliensis]CEA03878.1 hypothetical protein BN1048_02241 [Jeotgalicoccus saudimassiliensis]